MIFICFKINVILNPQITYPIMNIFCFVFLVNDYIHKWKVSILVHIVQHRIHEFYWLSILGCLIFTQQWLIFSCFLTHYKTFFVAPTSCRLLSFCCTHPSPPEQSLRTDSPKSQAPQYHVKVFPPSVSSSPFLTASYFEQSSVLCPIEKKNHDLLIYFLQTVITKPTDRFR